MLKGGGMMNNSIFSKLTQRIPQQHYNEPSSSFKIRGTLLEKDGNQVRISLGGDKVLEARMKEEVDGRVGETVIVDKKDILQSKVYQDGDGNLEISNPVQSREEEEILRSLDLPINEESKEALRVLEKYGIDITKENLRYFLASKNNLEEIISGLDYETAIKLMEKNIDIEKESLDKIAIAIDEIRGEKKEFSLLKLFTRNTEMSTEDAENKAFELYGNKMGKDITDAIKALHRAGLEINKSNIEKLNMIFDKLDNLQEIEETTIIDSLKNKIEVSIDNLYKLKNSITKNIIRGEGRLSTLANRAYETMAYQPSRVTRDDIRQMQPGIKDLLRGFGMEITENLMKTAEELIYRGLEVSKENIDQVQGVKIALHGLKDILDYEKTALIIKSGVEVEKENVMVLNKIAREITENIARENTDEIHQLAQGEETSINTSQRFLNMKGLIEGIALFKDKKEALLPLLIKNSLPINLKQISNMQLLLSNKDQIAPETQKILKLLERSDRKELREIEGKFKGFLKATSIEMKSGKFDIERTYNELAKWIREIENKAYLFNKTEKEALGKIGERLKDSLDLQNQLNRNDTMFQLPIMMENQLRNLQIYIMNKKRNSRKIDPNDMSVLLNFETNNMGNINIYTSINHKKVNMKIGVKNHRDRKIFEKNSHLIGELLSKIGYELRDMSFRVEEDQDLLSMAGELAGWNRPIRSLLDIKI